MFTVIPFLKTPLFSEDYFTKELKALEEDYRKIVRDYLHTDLPNQEFDNLYSPSKFVLDEETGTYKATFFVEKNTLIEDIKVELLKNDGETYVSVSCYCDDKDKKSRFSSVSQETLPQDLDTETLKASVKSGILTITGKQVQKPEKVEEAKQPTAGDEIEYEIEINL